MLGNISFVQLIAFVVLSYSMAAGGQKPVSKLAKPTPEQVAWQGMEVGMFIHFGSRTWTGSDKVALSLDKVNPSKLDTDQWVAAAEAIGAKYIVFVTKHKTGFCMWQTNTTDFSVKSIPWRNGKGDVLADLAESCRKRGIKLGVYLSPTDHNFGSRSRGRCKTKEEQERYNKVYRQQLTEILSRYGEMSEVWFDGSLEIEVGDILKKYAPNAMIFNTAYATIRYVGNESGLAPYPAWNAVSETAAKSGVSIARDGNPDGTTWLPLECDTEIRTKWFWKANNDANPLKSIDELMSIYYLSVGHGAVLLLNQAPDTSGLIPEADFQHGAEFGAEIKRRFGKSIAQTKGEGYSLELDLNKPTTIDHVITMEDITQGERVREYVIEGLVNGNWQLIASGSAIGHKKIDRFPLVKVAGVRFRATKSAAIPIITKLAVYNTMTSVSDLPCQQKTTVAYEAGSWNANIFDANRDATLEIDLTAYIDEATQYEVIFESISLDFTINSVTLLLDGLEAAEFVEPIKPVKGQPLGFNVNITAIPERKKGAVILRANMHGMEDLRGRSAGRISIRKSSL